MFGPKFYNVYRVQIQDISYSYYFSQFKHFPTVLGNYLVLLKSVKSIKKKRNTAKTLVLQITCN